MDGINFEKIGEVSGAGTSSQLQRYEFMHTNPIKGNNYYRLKQVDFDGYFEYSNIAVVNFENGKMPTQDIQVSIYPNPTEDVLNIEISEFQEGLINFSIYNTLGQIVIREYQINPSELATINVQSIPNGTYLLRIQGVGKAMRFIKK
ncbi:MAG: hypothetical protein ACI9XO_000378 [Paraglaciecola sp.]